MSLTLQDIRDILGPVDEALAADLLRVDASRGELAEAAAWIDADEAFANAGRRPPAGTVAVLIDILAANDLDDEPDAPSGPEVAS